MPDVALELSAVNALALLTGFSITNIRRGPDACGIDVLFEIDGRRVGAQHTAFHWDEGVTPGVRGSLAREKEEKNLSKHGWPYPFSVNPHSRLALQRCVDKKIEKAASHDNRDLETWLVISAWLWRSASATCSSVASENTTPKPKVSSGRFRSTTVMSWAGSDFFMSRLK